MKTCFKCGVAKPVEEFYRHPQMGDGHLGKCKDCTKQDMRNDRHTKPRVRQYDRERARLPHRVALQKRISEQWRQRFPDRKKAQQAANNAIRDGRLKRGEHCEGCGLQKPIQKHHPDYARPLLVLWLCKPCHAIADKVRRVLERTAS